MGVRQWVHLGGWIWFKKEFSDVLHLDTVVVEGFASSRKFLTCCM